MNDKILIVDDEKDVLSALKRNLRKDFSVDTAVGGFEALKKIGSGQIYSVIIADMKMPGMDGINLLNIVKERSPDTVRMMLTGNADMTTAIEAVNKGEIFRFLTKPCSPEILKKSIEAGIEQYRLITAEKELLEKTVQGVIRVLTETLAVVDPESFGQTSNLRDSVQTVIKELKIKNSLDIEMATMLLPIGQITIPPSVLVKMKGKRAFLSNEKEMIEQIPEIGYRLLKNIPRLDEVARIVRYQNKSYDGDGIPYDDISGEDIPIGSRILKVVSDIKNFQANNSDSKILRMMENRKGYYDPKILKAAGNCLLRQNTAATPIPLKDLKIGQKLALNIDSNANKMVLPAGQVISEGILERLLNYAKVKGIKEPVYIVRKSDYQN